MGGIGSDPNYNPNSGYGMSSGMPVDLSSASTAVMSGLGSAFGALGSVASSVTQAVQDPALTSTVSQTAGSFWGSLSAGASTFVTSVTAPDGGGSDGLEDLHRQFHSQAKPDSKYAGFGSDNTMNSYTGNGGGGGSGFGNATTSATAPDFLSGSTLTEARPGPGEDPNGIERLSGESDEQYVMRQTRLRDEAKARMAAKFGGGGMGGVGSSSSVSAPPSGGFGGASASAAQGPKAPNSGGVKVASGGDFFADFGT